MSLKHSQSFRYSTRDIIQMSVSSFSQDLYNIFTFIKSIMYLFKGHKWVVS